jgi:chromosome segregation ATPase
MKFFRIKFFIILFAILLFLGFGYYYKEDAIRLFQELQNKIQPCQNPIKYSIADIDSRFGLTEEELLNNIKEAEKIWESSIDKQLFEYSPAGNLKISLIYDYRQNATDALKKIGIVLNDDQATYDALKAKYNFLIATYNKERAQLEILIKSYNAEKVAFEKDVDYWNSRGGAPKSEFKTLEQRRADLNSQIAIINQAENSLNELVDTIKSTEIVLNKLIATLNLQVNKYNTVVSSTGKEFNQGEYVRNADGTVISIFQFNDKNQLIRVLAHELGHALGLDHIDNQKAIMYYLNEGMNQKLTADDLSALKGICKIEEN